MKKVFLFVLSCCMFSMMQAQNIVKEHYTVSGGLLGAANFSKFRVGGTNSANVDYNTETGFIPQSRIQDCSRCFANQHHDHFPT